MEDVDTISKPLSECICTHNRNMDFNWLPCLLHNRGMKHEVCVCVCLQCLLLFPDFLCTHALNTGEGRLGDGTHSHSVSQCSVFRDILSTKEATGYIYTRDYLGAEGEFSISDVLGYVPVFQ